MDWKILRAVGAFVRYAADMEIILASRSPRRLMLLQSAGLAVEVRPSHIDESARPGEPVRNLVDRLSRSKALAIDAPADVPVIAADTLVAVGDHLLGQPCDLADAKTMLQRLSGRAHQVITGVCVRLNGQLLQQHIVTGVRFRELDETEIDTYLAHNDILDKAGAYAIQGGAASFITAIDGPLDNVIGLPLHTTLQMLAALRDRQAAAD
jgi:septum formation protein